MILILTDKHDIHASTLIDQLNQDKVACFRLNLDVNSLEKTHIKFDGITWHIQTVDGNIDLRTIESVWNRKTFVQLMLEEQNKGFEFNIWKNEWNKTLLGMYYFLSEKKWLNYYRDNHKAENKYLQMAIAKKIGFNLPKFLLTNKKNEILQFASDSHKVVMKLMNQDFYEVEKGTFKGVLC